MVIKNPEFLLNFFKDKLIKIIFSKNVREKNQFVIWLKDRYFVNWTIIKLFNKRYLFWYEDLKYRKYLDFFLFKILLLGILFYELLKYSIFVFILFALIKYFCLINCKIRCL